MSQDHEVRAGGFSRAYAIRTVEDIATPGFPLQRLLENLSALARAFGDVRGATPGALVPLAGPAVRGLLLQRGKGADSTVRSTRAATFNWRYGHDRPEMARLHHAAREGQWDPDVVLPWATSVDPFNPDVPLVTGSHSPLPELPAFNRLSQHEQLRQQRDMAAWTLSQFLHGEQGALFVACELVEGLSWADAKHFGASQVLDEARHVEVFDRYVSTKLERRYAIDDNLFVMLDAVLTDARWDMKMLGMQIVVEGLALGAFGALRAATKEPLLRELLRRVMLDEVRHVQFGVAALEGHFDAVTAGERRAREDWAFEMCVLLRNRFLGHEIYDEHWAHAMSRRAWDRWVLGTAYMRRFRINIFRRIIPNLKRVGLLSARVRPAYASLGLLEMEHDAAAPEMRMEELER